MSTADKLYLEKGTTLMVHFGHTRTHSTGTDDETGLGLEVLEHFTWDRSQQIVQIQRL